MNLKDKNVIVTGAASGIGRELVLQLVDKGASVAALDLNVNELEVTKSMAKDQKKVTIHKVDVSNDEDLTKFYGEFSDTYPDADCLINNAGIIQPFINVGDLDMNVVEKVMNVNFYGPLKLTKLFLPDLLKRDEANITNVSSMGGFFPFPGQTVYGSSKAALKILSEGMYSELLDTNVNVMLALPGAIETNITKNSNVESKVSNEDSKMKMTSASDAAKQIIDGIEKKKFKIYVGTDSKIMNLMYKFNDKKAIGFINKKMKEMNN